MENKEEIEKQLEAIEKHIKEEERLSDDGATSIYNSLQQNVEDKLLAPIFSLPSDNQEFNKIRIKVNLEEFEKLKNKILSDLK